MFAYVNADKMISFHFTYKLQSYIAQANINEHNGEIVCELLGILSDELNQAVSFQDLELGNLQKGKNALTQAIEMGLSKYLDNFPVGHCK